MTLLLKMLFLKYLEQGLLFVTLSSYLFKFSCLSFTLTSEHDTDEFYNCNSKKIFS